MYICMILIFGFWYIDINLHYYKTPCFFYRIGIEAGKWSQDGICEQCHLGTARSFSDSGGKQQQKWCSPWEVVMAGQPTPP